MYFTLKEREQFGGVFIGGYGMVLFIQFDPPGHLKDPQDKLSELHIGVTLAHQSGMAQYLCNLCKARASLLMQHGPLELSC